MSESSVPLTLPVSLVIPCGADEVALASVLAAVESGTCWPAEVLVVDASQQLQGRAPCADPFSSLVQVIESPGPLFPGAARNLGCDAASMDWLAFLDLNTLPSPQWLEAVYALAQQHPGVELVLGATRYRSQGWQRRLFISAIYGERPLPTLPGSLVHRSVFGRVGGFLPDIRAGEDTDWLVRINQFSIPHISGLSTPLIYSAVPGSLGALAVKWFRNYRSSAPVVFHLEAHKTIYVVAANLIILFIAFNWNAIAADWRESSSFYIANITKVIFAGIVLAYLLIRGLVMPLRRGSAVKTVLPLRWVVIGLLCAVLDLAKLLAFVLPPWRHRYGLSSGINPLRVDLKLDHY